MHSGQCQVHVMDFKVQLAFMNSSRKLRFITELEQEVMQIPHVQIKGIPLKGLKVSATHDSAFQM